MIHGARINSSDISVALLKIMVTNLVAYKKRILLWFRAFLRAHSTKLTMSRLLKEIVG